MKVAVVGAGGMLGACVARVFTARGHDVIQIHHTELCASRLSQIAAADAAINCAAYLGPGAKDWRTAITANVLLPRKIASLQPHTIHISTDGVFSGDRGAYVETDRPDAGDIYGVTKSLGEPPEAMTLRLSVIGLSPNNGHQFIESLIRADVFRAYTNHHWNGLTTEAIAASLVRILEEELFSRGVYHLFSNDISKAELARKVCRAFQLSVKVSEVESPSPRDRRLRSIHGLCRTLSLPSIDEQIQQLARSWRAQR